MNCPKCNAALRAETYEGTRIDRCQQCKGTWLDEGELIAILNSREERFSAHVVEEAINTDFAGISAEEERSVERCPKCAKQMQAINYSYRSGIVLDRCPDSHGVWLDGPELAKVQAFTEHWEKEELANKQEWIALAKSVIRF